MKKWWLIVWSSFYGRVAMFALWAGLAFWAMFGTLATEKVVTNLILPAGLAWIVLTLVLVESVRQGGRSLIGLAAAAWLIYTLAGNPSVAGWLAKSREARYAEAHPMEQGRFDAVIVLGGGARLGATGRVQGNAAGDRLILAAQIYHAGLAEQLICTGRRIEALDSSGLDPAEQSSAILVALGVPERAIELAGGRNTAEEMRELAEKFSGTDQRIGILTSAWHLARAERLAKKRGIDAVPLPSDFITGPPGASRTGAAFFGALVPNADALVVSGRISREYLAGLIGR